MIQLRDIQVDPVNKGIAFFKQKKAVPSLMVMPTAFGKSIVISKIANDIGDKVLVLQPSKELLEQNLDKLRKLGGDASVYSASMGIKEIGHITYATIGSIKSIGSEFRKLGFKKMVIDEADRFPRGSSSMIGKFLKDSKITHVLGLTATPLKLQTLSDYFTGTKYSKLRMLTTRTKDGQFYKSIIHVCQIKEMVEGKYWSKLEYEVYKFKTGKLVYNTTKSEFTDESMKKVYKDQEIGARIVERIAQEKHRRSILAFVPSVDEAITLAKKIPGAEAVYGDMDNKERDRVITGFKNLEIRVVINVNVLSVGFDHPELDMIICGRPTASLSWWYQAIGRITRIHQDKKDGLVVDFAGNTLKFGKIEDLYFKQDGDGRWELYGEQGRKLTEVPIHEIGKYVDEDLPLVKEQPKPTGEFVPSTIKFTFGRYKDRFIHQAPRPYILWLANEYEFHESEHEVKQEVLRIKNYYDGS